MVCAGIRVQPYKKAWKKYGVDLHITAPGLTRTLAWGTRKYNEVRDNSPAVD